jgi:hypothetical protein
MIGLRRREIANYLNQQILEAVMKFVLALFVLVAASATAFAQTKDPITSAVKEILPRQQKNLIAAADEMPADKFSFKPTPEQISFGHLIMHIAQVNNFLCSKIGDMPAPAGPELKETDSKDVLVGALKASFDFCTAAMDKLNDAKLGDAVELRGGRTASRAFAIITLTNDWADHYSGEAMYLRLNGLLPPTAQPPKARVVPLHADPNPLS